MNNNLYPRSSEYIHQPPKELVEEQEAEKTLVFRESEVIRQVIKNLEKRIDFYLTIDALPDDERDLVIAVQANKKAVRALREEKEKLELMLEPSS